MTSSNDLRDSRGHAVEDREVRRLSTGNGRFRSQGEVQLARCLSRHGIGYLYEPPVAVVDRGKTKVWYPDFRLPGYSILLEYDGRLDDPAYAAMSARKHETYSANGLTVLSVMPEDLAGDWPNRLLDRLDHVMASRLEHFRDLREDLSR